MVLDAACQRNLELVKNIYDGSTRGTLLSVLDHTVTAMAGRKLREWLLNPLLDVQEIDARLAAVEELKERHQVRASLRTALGRVYDLERLISRVSLGAANARDLVALQHSFAVLPDLATYLAPSTAGLLAPARRMGRPAGHPRVHREAITTIPVHPARGRLIRKGHSAELDGLRAISTEGKGFIAAIEQRERERTGITTLKVSYNRVFGYYMK